MTVVIKKKQGTPGKKKPPAHIPKPKKVTLSDPSKKYKRIAEMSEEQRDVLHGMFDRNTAIPEIVAVVKEMGLFTDVKDATLGQYFYRYKWDVIDKQIIARAETLRSDGKAKVLAEVTQRFDVIQEIAELVTTQKTRVAKLLKREADMPMLFNSLGPEMKTLAGFVQQYADLSFELGFLKRVPKVSKITKDGEVTVIESDGKDHVSFNLENAQVVEDAAKAFFEALNQNKDTNEYEHAESLKA